MPLPLDLQETLVGHRVPYIPINPDHLFQLGPTRHCTAKQATKLRFFIWKCFQTHDVSPEAEINITYRPRLHMG